MSTQEIKTTYWKGHIYNKTGNRLIIKDNALITIKINTNNFDFAESGKFKGSVRSSDEMLITIQKKGYIKFSKLLNKGKNVFFFIIDKQKRIKHNFKVELIEDLYIYQIKNKNKTEIRFFNCKCMVTEQLDKYNQLLFFEKIIGNSLSDLYKNTSIQYFGSSRHSVTLIKDSVFTEENDEKSQISKLFKKAKWIERSEIIKK